jgi:hypothetical protein
MTDPKTTIPNKKQINSILKSKLYQQWFKQMYEFADKAPVHEYYDAFSFKGFDREEILALLFMKFQNDLKLVHELIALCSLRGPVKSANIKLSNGRTPMQMGIPAKLPKGSKGLTTSRIVAATADIAAFMFKKLKISKRIGTLDCPGWLQFPSAGSIKMSTILRVQHREFASAFSKQIGGVFDENIYQQMEMNAYLDESLNLFE